MQDVASRIDQSCRRCASGQRCVKATWSAAYIWLEVEQRLAALGASAAEDEGVWRTDATRAILSLMWHYGQRIYFESEESA
jgi:hypothetical protein